MEKWIKIKYDYVSKYCTICMIQGHDKEQCVKYPELFKKQENNRKGVDQMKDTKKTEATVVDGNSRKEEEENVENKKDDGFVQQKKKKSGWNDKMWLANVQTQNKFDTLDRDNEDIDPAKDSTTKEGEKQSTKKWVQDTFHSEQVEKSSGNTGKSEKGKKVTKQIPQEENA